MEYRGYTQEKINNDKTKNLILIIIVAVLAALMAFAAFSFLLNLSDIKVKNISEVSYLTVEAETEYYFDEIVLVDEYANVSDAITGIVEMRDYIVLFSDKDGELVYATVRTEGYSDITSKCESYMQDDSLYIGDVALEGCFHANENYGEKQEYFLEAYELYCQELPGERLDLTFYYDAASVDEFRSAESSGLTISAVASGVLFAVCAVGLIFLIRKRKELNRYSEEYQAPVEF